MVLDDKMFNEAMEKATSTPCFVVETEPGKYKAVADFLELRFFGPKCKKSPYAENDFFVVDTKDIKDGKEFVDNINKIISEIESNVYGPLSLSLMHEEIKQRTTYHVAKMQRLNEVPVLNIETDKDEIEKILKREMEKYFKKKAS